MQICSGPTIGIGRESWCLPYAGFLRNEFIRTEFIRNKIFRPEFIRTEFKRTNIIRTEFMKTEFIRNKFYHGLLPERHVMVLWPPSGSCEDI